MVRGIGIDIVGISRVKENILKNNGFLEKVYTEKEISYCNSKNKNMYNSYAGKYAAKEAVWKCIQNYNGKDEHLSYNDIEILNDEKGKPYVLIHNESYSDIAEDILVTISHDVDIAIAFATFKQYT